MTEINDRDKGGRGGGFFTFIYSIVIKYSCQIIIFIVMIALLKVFLNPLNTALGVTHALSHFWGHFNLHVVDLQSFGVELLLMQLQLVIISIFLGILYLFLKPIKDNLLIFLDLVEFECLRSKPVTLFLQLNHFLIRFSLKMFRVRLVFQLLHVLHNALHLSAKSNEKFILVS